MDGRSRFDFVMTPNGNVNVNSRAYQGPGVRCRVQFRPIAGFGDPQEAADADLRVRAAPQAACGRR